MLVAWLVSVLGSAGLAATVAVTAIPRADTAHNGRLLVVDITATQPPSAWSIHLGGHHGVVVPRGGQQYLGLVPINIEQKPATLELTIEAIAGGVPVGVITPIAVMDGGYERRTIKVGRQFTSPTKAQQARAKREAASMAAALTHSSPTSLWQQSFVRPTAGDETSPFGTLRTYNRKKKSRHLGLDLDGDVGDAIVASNSGRVVIAEQRFYSGGTVVIDHGQDLFSMYFHMSMIDVKVGHQVDAGAPLGAVGKSGQVTGPHLHFAVKLDGLYIDPAQVLALRLDRPAADADGAVQADDARSTTGGAPTSSSGMPQPPNLR
jgi:hypothetical protein